MIFISLLYSALSIPRSIEDDGETVVLKRLLWSKRYSRTTYDISEVSGIEVMNGLRVFGSGGYFGYSGYFYKTKIGLFKLLATEDTGHSYASSARAANARSTSPTGLPNPTLPYFSNRIFPLRS